MSQDSSSSVASRGVIAATAAFLLWGLVPIYWKQMQEVSAFELIAHRIVWSTLFLLIIMAVQKSLSELRLVFEDRTTFINSLSCSVLLSINWTVYVWGVNSGQIIETSLGYFLTPLLNVAMGFLFLRERPRILQWTAIVFAALGVALLLINAGHVPWIALTLAGSWSGYALLKKKSRLGEIAGLTVENLLVVPIAAALLLWRAYTGEGALGRVDASVQALIVSAGIVTSIPLLLFAHGAKRLRLTTLGLLQYIAPTVQFLIGLLLYLEPFDSTRLQAFALIWFGLILYSADSFWMQRRQLWAVAATTWSK